MSDERTELVERVENIVFEVMQQGVPKDVMDETVYGFTCRIIALVEADVARRLLSEPTLLAMCSALSLFEPGCDWGEVWDGRFDDPVHADAADEYYRMAQGTAKAALASIGIEPREDGEG